MLNSIKKFNVAILHLNWNHVNVLLHMRDTWIGIMEMYYYI